jgi:hypothetical protein
MRVALIFIALMSLAVHAADTVYVEPENATGNDAIVLHLYSESICCCALIYNMTMRVDDAEIYLDYEVDSEPCTRCYCFAPGMWLEVESEPLAAGSYTVYKVENYYCPPGRPCPMELILPERVGEIVIHGSTPVGRESVSLNPGTDNGIVESAGKRCFLLGPEVVRASLLDPAGRLVDSWNSSGNRRWSVGAPDGVFFLSLSTVTGDRIVERVAWRR